MMEIDYTHIHAFAAIVGYIVMLIGAAALGSAGIAAVQRFFRPAECRCYGLYPTQRVDAGPHHESGCVEYISPQEYDRIVRTPGRVVSHPIVHPDEDWMPEDDEEPHCP